MKCAYTIATSPFHHYHFTPRLQISTDRNHYGCCCGPRHRAAIRSIGNGLSYITFSYSDLKVAGGSTITAGFTVTNTGTCDGADVPQLYLAGAAGEQRVRLH